MINTTIHTHIHGQLRVKHSSDNVCFCAVGRNINHFELELRLLRKRRGMLTEFNEWIRNDKLAKRSEIVKCLRKELHNELAKKKLAKVQTIKSEV